MEPPPPPPMPDMSLAYAMLYFFCQHLQRAEYSSGYRQKVGDRTPFASLGVVRCPKVISRVHLKRIPAFRMDPGMRDMGYGQVGGLGG